MVIVAVVPFDSVTCLVGFESSASALTILNHYDASYLIIIISTRRKAEREEAKTRTRNSLVARETDNSERVHNDMKLFEM